MITNIVRLIFTETDNLDDIKMRNAKAHLFENILKSSDSFEGFVPVELEKQVEDQNVRSLVEQAVYFYGDYWNGLFEFFNVQNFRHLYPLHQRHCQAP